MPGPVRNPTEAYQQLEAIMLRQMLQSSGAFKASSTPGAQLRTDMFVETLADAVAKAGGLGIARMLERQLGAGDPSPSLHGSAALPPVPGAPAWASASPRAGLAAMAPTTGTMGAVGADDLDDPNSEAPLPEDPMAPSIDDYQTAPAARPGRHASPGFSIGTTARALNRYKERVEVTGAGNPVLTGVPREKP